MTSPSATPRPAPKPIPSHTGKVRRLKKRTEARTPAPKPSPVLTRVLEMTTSHWVSNCRLVATVSPMSRCDASGMMRVVWSCQWYGQVRSQFSWRVLQLALITGHIVALFRALDMTIAPTFLTVAFCWVDQNEAILEILPVKRFYWQSAWAVASDNHQCLSICANSLFPISFFDSNSTQHHDTTNATRQERSNRPLPSHRRSSTISLIINSQANQPSIILTLSLSRFSEADLRVWATVVEDMMQIEGGMDREWGFGNNDNIAKSQKAKKLPCSALGPISVSWTTGLGIWPNGPDPHLWQTPPVVFWVVILIYNCPNPPLLTSTLCSFFRRLSHVAYYVSMGGPTAKSTNVCH